MLDPLSRRQRRKVEVKARAGRPDLQYKYCRLVECRNLARAATADGLDTRYCRVHADQLQRHGSPYKKSYLAKALNPYRRAALAWLEANNEDFWVRNAVERVQGLYQEAGQHEDAFRLRGKTAHERAKIHWARLRKAEIHPYLVITAWLSVEMVIQDDSQPVRTKEFKRVQAAKLVHRMASGSHRRWAQEIRDLHKPGHTKLHVTEMHVYPRSRGQVLRHIGQDLEGAVELLVDHHLKEIQDLKKQRDHRGLFNDRPFPKGTVGRKRKKAI
jgi:hypothetical protein